MDLSSHTPVYVRVTGSDANDGSTVELAVATVQHAYDLAFASSGNIVIDLDANIYAGVILSGEEALAAGWPDRIAVRGVGSTSSLLGGITGQGRDGFMSYVDFGDGTGFDYPMGGGFGPPLHIVSDGSVNLGNLLTAGGSDGGITEPPGHGGIVTLVDCVAETIATPQGLDTASICNITTGPITLTRSVATLLVVRPSASSLTASQAGNITLIDAHVDSVDMSGGDSLTDVGSSAGTLYLTRSFVRSITAIPGAGYDDSATSAHVHFTDSAFSVANNSGELPIQVQSSDILGTGLL